MSKHEPTHPGESIGDAMREAGLNATELAVALNMERGNLYARLAPGVLEKLRGRNPTQPGGNRKNKHHQWFTPDLGHPKLKEHLAAVIALMRAAANWGQFQRSLKRAFPVLNDQYEMNLGDDG